MKHIVSMRIQVKPSCPNRRLRRSVPLSCRAQAAATQLQPSSAIHKYRNVTSVGRPVCCARSMPTVPAADAWQPRPQVVVTVEEHAQALLVDVTVQSLPSDATNGPVLQW
jgi:hypothetical protein